MTVCICSLIVEDSNVVWERFYRYLDRECHFSEEKRDHSNVVGESVE